MGLRVAIGCGLTLQTAADTLDPPHLAGEVNMKPYQKSRIFWLSVAIAGVSASLAVVQSSDAVPELAKVVAAAVVAGCGAVAAILRVEDSRGGK